MWWIEAYLFGLRLARKGEADHRESFFQEAISGDGFARVQQPQVRRPWAKRTGRLLKHPDYTCAVKRHWSTAGESPARELGSLHPEAIGAAGEETKPSEPPV